MPSLNEAQIFRYSRHILLPDVGGVGQERLLAAGARVTVGPGCAAEICALVYLAAAGVGRLCLSGDPHGTVTGEEIEGGIAYGASDVGRPRIEALRDRLCVLNPDVEVIAVSDGPDCRLPLLEVRGADPAEGPEGALLRGALAAARFAGEVARR